MVTPVATMVTSLPAGPRQSTGRVPACRIRWHCSRSAVAAYAGWLEVRHGALLSNFSASLFSVSGLCRSLSPAFENTREITANTLEIMPASARERSVSGDLGVRITCAFFCRRFVFRSAHALSTIIRRTLTLTTRSAREARARLESQAGRKIQSECSN